MRLAGALLLLLASAAGATAPDDCALGWYWNGVKCQPLQVYLPNERNYWTRFFPEKGYPNCTTGGCCPSGYTIQDKVCKPYVGR
jgi:hypothetical protein